MNRSYAWAVILAVIFAVVIGGGIAWKLKRPLPPVTPMPEPIFMIKRQEAVLIIMEMVYFTDLRAIVVGAQKYPQGVDEQQGPVWVVLIDLFHTPQGPGGAWERRGCVVDGMTGKIHLCAGGELNWVLAD